MLAKTNAHVMMDKLNGWILLIENDDSQRWYKKEFDSEPVYNNKFLKTKIKPHDDEVTDFYVKSSKGELE